MTELIHSMPLAIGLKAMDAQSEASEIDAWARRLAASIGRGDEAAFAELYDRYHGRLFRLTASVTRGDETLAHETVQSVFLTVAARLRGVETEEHLWNWLAAVARQHLGKVWRRQKRAPAMVSMSSLPDVAEFEPDHVLEQRLDAALLSMDESDRQLIEWFYFDGLSHKDIADRMSATPKAVSSRLERARAKLREVLSKNEI